MNPAIRPLWAISSGEKAKTKVQVEPRYLKQEAEPDKDAVVPAEQNELKDRNGYERVPASGWSVAGDQACDCRVPRIRAERERLTPDCGAGESHQEQQRDLDSYRIP